MTNEDARKLPLGLYRITWKADCGGGESLAAVGQRDNGERWLAPCNWSGVVLFSTAWGAVAYVELLEDAALPGDNDRDFLHDNDRDFLQWIHDRLINIHDEDGSVDYLHKLRTIIKATSPEQRTPNIGSVPPCCPLPSLEDEVTVFDKHGGQLAGPWIVRGRTASSDGSVTLEIKLPKR